MKVLLSGASGLIGRQLAAYLAARGDTVEGLSRKPGRLEGLSGLSGGHAWSPREAPLPSASLEGVDALVHLAGESVQGRWTKAKRASIRASRVEGTRNLVAGLAASEKKPQVLICASAVGVYGDRGDEPLDEGSPLGSTSDFLASVCHEWEAEAERATELGIRVVYLRTGLVLAREGGALAEMLTPFKLGLGGRLGSGTQWWSWIHVGDLLRLIAFALDEPTLRGPLNATAPTPVRQADFAKALGKALGRPTFLPAPAFALRAALGGFSVEILSSKQVFPRAAEAAGFSFDHPQLASALEDLLSQ